MAPEEANNRKYLFRKISYIIDIEIIDELKAA
jgi:hypothetical protein